MLRERHQAQRTIYYMILLIQNVQNRQMHIVRKYILPIAERAGVGESGGNQDDF